MPTPQIFHFLRPICLLLLCAIFGTGCGVTFPGSVSQSNAASADPGPNGPWVTAFQLVGQSQNVKVMQGYASGVTSSEPDLNYFFDTGALFLSSSDETLLPVAGNTSLLLPGTTHQGAGDYYAGKVYSVVENWHGCSRPDTPIFVQTFDGTTLQSLGTADISAYLPEASGIAIDRYTGEAIVSSYCVSGQLYVFDRTTWQLKRTIPLSTPIAGIQGVTYRGGFIYIGSTGGGLYGLHLLDKSMRLLLSANGGGEYEGPNFNSGQMRWLMNDGKTNTHILYYYDPVYQTP